VQIVLYCIFYSFARLLISADIFVNYPSVYLSALFTLVIIMCLLALFGASYEGDNLRIDASSPHFQQPVQENLEGYHGMA